MVVVLTFTVSNQTSYKKLLQLLIGSVTNFVNYRKTCWSSHSTRKNLTFSEKLWARIIRIKNICLFISLLVMNYTAHYHLNFLLFCIFSYCSNSAEIINNWQRAGGKGNKQNNTWGHCNFSAGELSLVPTLPSRQPEVSDTIQNSQ